MGSLLITAACQLGEPRPDLTGTAQTARSGRRPRRQAAGAVAMPSYSTLCVGRGELGFFHA